MASTEFVAVSWQPTELIDEDSLDQISNNLLYLRNQMIDGKYQNLGGGIVDTNLKQLCGRTIIEPRNSDTASIRVSFGTMFTPGSVPVVTTALVSMHRVRIVHVIHGIGRFWPSEQGFEINIALNDSKAKIKEPVGINWQAMGY